MRLIPLSIGILLALSLSACAMHNRFTVSNTTSLVSYLYGKDETPPNDDLIPELRVPLRVGLAFLPSHNAHSAGTVDADTREQLLQKVRQRFIDRKFVKDIVVIPDYYLAQGRGFDGLAGLQRLYSVDVLALISYDQVTHSEDNDWSLSYLTIVGAYLVKGTRHEVATLVDLAVVDPKTRSLILRAGGVGRTQGHSTLIDSRREVREAASTVMSTATDEMIRNFDAALTRFETDVRAGKANVRVANRNSNGGGAANATLIALLAGLLLMNAARRMANWKWRLIRELK